MSEESNSVPVLDLAPKRKKPLSLWNPLDYLTLLYWAFFFPQAIRWYIENFGDPRYREVRLRSKAWDAARRDRAQRSLIFQVAVMIVFGGAGIFFALGAEIFWFFFILAFSSFIVSVANLGVARGVVFGIVSGVVFGVVSGVLPSYLIENVPSGTAPGEISAGWSGVAFAGILAMLLGFSFDAVFDPASRVVAGFVSTDAFIVVISGITFGFAQGAADGIIFAAVVVILRSRFLDWAVSLPMNIRPFPCLPSRMVWLPLFGARKQIESWLERDWSLGVRNVNQLLAFSLQFIPAVRALNEVLARCPPGDLLRRVSILAEKPRDWNLLRFGSVSLRNRFLWVAIKGPFVMAVFFQRDWRTKYLADFRFDTPARSACAGFWLWHWEEPGRAEEAFAKVREIPFGAELHGISRAIATALEIGDLEELAGWREEVSWISRLPEERLRPATVKTLEMLLAVSEEASVACRALAPLNRSTALGRAGAELDRLASTAEQVCPYPEWPLVQEIAKSWLKIVIEAAGVIGEEVLRKPVPNPYEGYSGLPVTGATFIGRHDVFLKFETLWASGDTLPVVFLYGHRRMGKTSILRNLEHAAPRGTLLVYLDMQDSSFVDHTGELLLDLAEGAHRRAVEVGLDAGPPPDGARYERLGESRRELNALFTRLDSQMEGRRLIIAIDEFERIEKAIADGRVDADVLAYLRSLNQRHRWLALVFGGLHTLEEMGRDYQNAFFGQTEHIRVGYLSKEDTVRLVTQPHPDFALEYDPALRDELYRLTFGQPFLLQRICWEMVNRWNERFLKEGEKTPRVLTLADLEPVLDDDLYSGAAYYFDGVWSNVTEEERRVMAALAGREKGRDREELAGRLGVTFEEIARIVNLLKRHDVITEGADGIRFASELMRRWVVRSGFARIDSEEA